MTQITDEQREHFEAVAVQATAKLEAFRDGLTADERAILSLGLWQAMAEAAGADESVVGFASNGGWSGNSPAGEFAKEVGKAIAIDLIYQGVKAAWGWITAPSNSTWPGPPSH
jgi:hypothetical protein